MESDVSEVLAYFKTVSILPIERKEQMNHLKNSLSEFKRRVLNQQHILMEVTDDDDTMALMNLSKFQDRVALYE